MDFLQAFQKQKRRIKSGGKAAAGEVEILTIGTRPAFRRKGIARALAAALIG